MFFLFYKSRDIRIRNCGHGEVDIGYRCRSSKISSNDRKYVAHIPDCSGWVKVLDEPRNRSTSDFERNGNAVFDDC